MNSRHYKPIVLLFGFIIVNLTSSCKAETSLDVLPSVQSDTTIFAKGADNSWLPQMETTGYKFFSDNGVEEDCFKILKDHGINSIRLRTFVNPSTDRASGHCSKAETVAMAVRAKQWGMRIMIDFHYSDTWADPGHQAKPAAWVGHDFPTLLTDLYNYTFDVMTALKTAGVTPEWVQVGNEIPGGMIYPEGSNATSWTKLIQLINKLKQCLQHPKLYSILLGEMIIHFSVGGSMLRKQTVPNMMLSVCPIIRIGRLEVPITLYLSMIWVKI
jgi:arabinogalactan endo-1,4-beta-galactosidase